MCIDFYDLSAWDGCWFVVYIRFIYQFLCPGSNNRGPIVFVLFVCLSVVNFNIRYITFEPLEVDKLNWLFNVIINDISVIYVTAQRCAGGLNKRLNLQSGSQRHRHFVGFFNVPVQAPTRDHPSDDSDTPPAFSRLLRSRWGYGGHIPDLKYFIFGMHTPLMMPFQMTQMSMTLWPWLWPLL